MRPIVRNVVNHEEIKQHLEKLKRYSPDPLYHEFIDKNVRNYLTKTAIINETPEGFIAPFPGPYHKVSFDKIEMTEIENLCKDTSIRIHTKELDSSLSITKIQLNEIISKNLEFIGSTNSFQVYKILNKKTLNEIGNELGNCLSYRNPKPSEFFYVLKNKKTLKNEIVLYIESDFIIEARRNKDTLPHEHDWSEIFSFFQGMVKGRLKPSSTIISYGLFITSLFTFSFHFWNPSFDTSNIAIPIATFCLFYCLFANLDSRFLHKILNRPHIKKFFYET